MVKATSFAGHHIYAGLDIGKSSWKVCILTEQIEHKTFTQPPAVGVLAQYLKRTFPGAAHHCVYEAGRFGFWIHDQLVHDGIECLVVNPADVPSTNRETTRKNDRIDARKLARYLRSGDLTSIYIPSRAACEDRSLVRSRQLLVSKQTRCKNQIKALLGFYGIDIPQDLNDYNWTRRFITWLQSVSFESESGNQSLRVFIKELLHLRECILELTKVIRNLAHEERFWCHVRNLITIPGISILTAMTFLTELVELDRFKTLDELASYVGLIPGEHSSGEREIITGITRRQNAALRSALIESAWIAARKDPALILAFNTLAKRMPKNRAIIRIARKLLNRIRYVLKNRQPYTIAVVQ